MVAELPEVGDMPELDGGVETELPELGGGTEPEPVGEAGPELVGGTEPEPDGGV